MLTLERPSPTAAADPPFVERIRSAIELLEHAAADWRLLDELPAADRRRLHRAVAGLSVPDRRACRKRNKAATAEKVRLEEGLLNHIFAGRPVAQAAVDERQQSPLEALDELPPGASVPGAQR